VDGTLIEAWASLKSFQRKEQEKQENGDEEKDRGNANVNFRGEKRSNQTHESKTNPDAKLARKGDGKEAKLSYNGNLLVENRNGLIVDATVLEATGTAERDAALAMMEKIPGQQRVTVAGDKGYDTRDFVAECRNLQVTPHVAQNEGRRGGSAIDGRTTRHAGYAVSQRKRKRIEECFGWMKTHWPAAQTSAPWFVEGGLGVYFYGCGLQSGADKKSATSRVSWRPECVWKRLQTTSGAKKTGISGLISGEAFYFWYGLA